MKSLLRLWCRFSGHQPPVDVEHGQVLTFVMFRCRRCGARWFVTLEDWM